MIIEQEIIGLKRCKMFSFLKSEVINCAQNTHEIELFLFLIKGRNVCNAPSNQTK